MGPITPMVSPLLAAPGGEYDIYASADQSEWGW